MKTVGLCLLDGCHQVQLERRQKYCKTCGCKARHDAQVKRIRRAQAQVSQPSGTDAVMAKLRRRYEEALGRRQRNEVIFENRTFAMFDIETTDLNANYGQLICGCVKPLGRKPVAIVAGDDDREAVIALRDELEKYDYIVTWYGTNFDIKFLNTRLLSHGERPLAPFQHIDLYYTAKRVLKLNSYRLGVVAEALLGRTEKTRIRGDIWQKAMRGDEGALNYIVDHCIKDVRDLERLFKRLYQFRDLHGVPVKAFA